MHSYLIHSDFPACLEEVIHIPSATRHGQLRLSGSEEEMFQVLMRDKNIFRPVNLRHLRSAHECFQRSAP